MIVVDESTDGTARIIARHADLDRSGQCVAGRRDRNFAAKVHSVNAGYETVRALDPQIEANVASEVSASSDDLTPF